MTNNTSEEEYFWGKKPDKIYISKRILAQRNDFATGDNIIIPIRYVSKVIDSSETFSFIKEKNEIVLRVSDGERQEIIAKILEDNRGIYISQIQKYTKQTGSPHNTYFSFRGNEIEKLFQFIKSIPELNIDTENASKINENDLKGIILSKQQAHTIYKKNQDLFNEIFQNNISHGDIKNLIYRKQQIEYFERLLLDDSFFEQEKIKSNIQRDEMLWQAFFERNTWIFGFGLQYVINIPLQNKKLEQVVSGFDVVNKGKRVDACMKSKGIISSLCFAEIKTHRTKLINSEYRPSVYPPSNELSGGIAQIQKTVQISVENLVNKIEPTNLNGDPTGEVIHIYKPKSFLLIGKLSEFITEHGINKEKYSSFELYRRSMKDTEIITFDELLERAKFVVYSDDNIE